VPNILRFGVDIYLAVGSNKITIEAGNRKVSVNVVRIDYTIPPMQPTRISVQAKVGAADVTIKPVFGADSYNIYYASSPGVTKTNFSALPNGNKVTGATTHETITGLTIGIDYYFVVTSANSYGESAESLEFRAHVGTTLSFDIKTFRFTWTDEPNATHYRLLENPDGISGYSQVGGDIPQGTETFDHIVPLYKRINASYILQSCIDVDCTDLGLFYIIDNLVDAIGYIKASDAGSTNFVGRFGASVSLSGDGNTLAVGAERGNSVYVFSRGGSNWSQEAYVKASDTESGDQFGNSVSLSSDGTTLAVGAIGEDSSTRGINTIPDDMATFAGAVYLFSRGGSNWSQEAYVKASDTESGDNFGRSVSLSGDGNTLAVGANGQNTWEGAVYVFNRSFRTWRQHAFVKASNTESGDNFGNSVSLSSDGNTLAVGAINESSSTRGINTIPDDMATFAGAVYLFSRNDSNWSQQAYVKASNTEAMDSFGYAVSLSSDGNTLAVGAISEDSRTRGINMIPDESALGAGAVYVFSRSGNDWSQEAYVKASNTDTHDSFGNSISLSGDGNTLAVGASGKAIANGGIDFFGHPDFDYGAVYLY